MEAVYGRIYIELCTFRLHLNKIRAAELTTVYRGRKAGKIASYNLIFNVTRGGASLKTYFVYVSRYRNDIAYDIYSVFSIPLLIFTVARYKVMRLSLAHFSRY